MSLAPETDSRANVTALFLDAMAKVIAAGPTLTEAHEIARQIYDRGFDDSSHLADRVIKRTFGR